MQNEQLTVQTYSITFLKPFFGLWILSASSNNVSRFESDEHCKNMNKQNKKQETEAETMF